MTTTPETRFIQTLWDPGGVQAAISLNPHTGSYHVEFCCEYVTCSGLVTECRFIDDLAALLPDFIRDVHAHISNLKAAAKEPNFRFLNGQRMLGKQSLSPVAEKLFALVEELTDFANDFTDRLSFVDYDSLADMSARLLGYGNLLESRDRQKFVNEEIRAAQELLAFLKSRVQGPD